jgi:hypothetical protein
MVSSLYYIISGGLVLLGLILFFVMATKRGYRSEPKVDIPENEHIEHYTEIRDEVTIRKPRKKKVVEEDETSGGFNFVSLAVGLVGFGIAFMVFTTIMSTVSSTLCDQSMNVSYGNDVMTQNMIGSCVDGKATGGVFGTLIPIMGVIGLVFVLLNVFRVNA